MEIDLYTIYLYNYANEFLFQKNVDLMKIKEFSNSSRVIFKDDFQFEKVVGNNVLEFLNYLKKRGCYKSGLLIHNKKYLIIKFWCNFSLEYWHSSPVKDFCREGCYLEFKKVHEELWAKKYLSLTEEEEKEWRMRFKKNNYIN